MAGFQINIEDLINKRRIESNRIEFKRGWNPSDIYQTICAFANDYENIGGGYILVGVAQDENGVAIRPVQGLPLEQIDKIQKEMIGYDAKIKPEYVTRTEIAEVDGKHILAIWAPARNNRPYSVPENVVAKQVSNTKYYIRSKSSSIEAKGEMLHELFDMANNTPFDERGNPNITAEDISPILVYDHLKRVNSKLLQTFDSAKILDTLDAMELLIGPTEDRMIKNVAAMMFCPYPEKFFPVTQVDIVHFPEGSIENPDVMIEAPKIIGPVPKIINETLSYLRTNVVKQRITKPSDTEKSVKTFNYPYQAFEEAVVNALYHRDYMEREPVEITIEPTHVDILSYAGPDRSISAKAIKEARKLKARRYRNRRLGDFLKELGLTEGRATGIPTIQKHLRLNGNPPATIETDDDRTYFLMTIPCREDMIGQNDIVTANQEGDTTQLARIKSSLANELANDDLQVYVGDKVNVDMLVNGLVNLISQVYLQVWEKAETDQTLMIVDVLRMFLSVRANSLTSTELLNQSNISSLYKLRRYILDPAISAGYIEMSNPEKPTSSKQKYLLTEVGKSLFIHNLESKSDVDGE